MITIVVAHFKEDLSWLEKSPYPVVVCDKAGALQPSPFQSDPKCSLPVNLGREAASYLKYIIEYWDELPEHVAFIHGHEDAWHQKYPGSLLDAMKNARIDKYDYISLNNWIHVSTPVRFCTSLDVYPRGETNSHPEVFMLFKHHWDLFKQIFKKESVPEYFKFNCSAQFIVSRNAIKNNPKTLYEELFQFVKNDTYWTTILLEFAWDNLFGDIQDYADDEEYRKLRFSSTI